MDRHTGAIFIPRSREKIVKLRDGQSCLVKRILLGFQNAEDADPIRLILFLPEADKQFVISQQHFHPPLFIRRNGHVFTHPAVRQFQIRPKRVHGHGPPESLAGQLPIVEALAGERILGEGGTGHHQCDHQHGCVYGLTQKKTGNRLFCFGLFFIAWFSSPRMRERRAGEGTTSLPSSCKHKTVIRIGSS